MPWIRMETITPITAITAHAGFLSRWNFSCTVAIGASYRLISEVSPANNTATKKMTTMIFPPGIFLIRFGRKINNNPGPP